MSHHRIWKLFLFTVALLIFSFSFKTLFDLYQFLALSQSSSVCELEPKIRKTKKGLYVLDTSFSYQVGEQTYSRSIRNFCKKSYKNRWVAQEALLKVIDEPHSVWYSKSYPQKGQLDKKFPVKRIFSTTILVGILVYFFLLGKVMFTME